MSRRIGFVHAGLARAGLARAGLARVNGALTVAVLANFVLLMPIISVHAEPIGDAQQGAIVFQKCAVCHQVGVGAKHRVGPVLNGLFGRRAASAASARGPAGAGFRYSTAMQRAQMQGLTWEHETLDEFLTNPNAMIAQTKMTFRGLKRAQDRADVLAYLRLFSDQPSDSPEASPTAAMTDPAHEVAVPTDVLTTVGDAEYGAYLANDCTACHQRDGTDQGIPSITHWPVETFVRALHAYKEKKRPHPVMQMMAARLSDAEIAALAAYFKDLD